MSMARKRRGTRRNFLKIPMDQGIVLSTLGGKTVIESADTKALAQAAWITSVDVAVGLDGMTDGEGPLLCIMSDAPLTVTEIKEALEAAPASQADIPAVEHARRRVRKVGVFDNSGVGAVLGRGGAGGKPVRVKLGWEVANGGTLPIIGVYNLDTSALTTGGALESQLTFWGNWK